MKHIRGEQVSGTSQSKASSSHGKARHHPYPNKTRRPVSEDPLPGVQKIKSSLRQARRLLAKENIAANVRVETERRIKALEADLAKAQHVRKERTMAARYHKVKFFGGWFRSSYRSPYLSPHEERQKVVRKIKQVKRSLQTAQEKEKENLEQALLDLRVDLNYILHYPKMKKYISLFPPEVRNSDTTPAPIQTKEDERYNIRKLIRLRMERGELSLEPENEMEKPDRDRSFDLRHGGKDDESADRGKGSSKVSKPMEDISGDEFFGEEDGDAEDSESSSVCSD
ncbi:hypothetical protein ID866_956 [Astraeus odoratus]|nr:hypothetical protein ID866_956 [Astraeus odoratus]